MTPKVEQSRAPHPNLVPLTTQSGWNARLWKMPRFPLEEVQRESLAVSMVHLCSLAAAAGLKGQVFLQNWKLSSETGNDLVTAHLPQWQPRRGLGVWPGGPSPCSWTEESLMNAAAAAFQGQEPQVPVHHLLQLQAGAEQLPMAVRAMTGRGVNLTVFALEEPSELLKRNAAFYRAQVEGKFKRSPFFLPLLDEAHLLSLSGLELAGEWMQGLQLYLRESAEDNGVLMVYRSSYSHVVDNWF